MKKKPIVIFSVSCALGFFGSLPSAGQNACHDDNGNVIPCKETFYRYIDQDGHYDIHPTTYIKLDSKGNSLPVTADSWVMVRDNNTGSIWEVKRNRDGVKDYNDPRDSDNIYTWYDRNAVTNGGDAGARGDGTDTRDFIEALNNAHFGGYSNWRLPSTKELVYLVDYSKISDRYDRDTIYINSTYFPNTIVSYYWSSTSNSFLPYYGWAMDFHFGKDDWRYKNTAHYVRPVRYEQQ